MVGIMSLDFEKIYQMAWSRRWSYQPETYRSNINAMYSMGGMTDDMLNSLLGNDLTRDFVLYLISGYYIMPGDIKLRDVLDLQHIPYGVPVSPKLPIMPPTMNPGRFCDYRIEMGSEVMPFDKVVAHLLSEGLYSDEYNNIVLDWQELLLEQIIVFNQVSVFYPRGIRQCASALNARKHHFLEVSTSGRWSRNRYKQVYKGEI